MSNFSGSNIADSLVVPNKTAICTNNQLLNAKMLLCLLPGQIRPNTASQLVIFVFTKVEEKGILYWSTHISLYLNTL